MAILKSLNVIWFLFSLTLVSSTWSLAVKERLSMCSRFTGSLQAFFFSSNADPTSNSVNQFPMSKLPALPSINSEYYSMLISQVCYIECYRYCSYFCICRVYVVYLLMTFNLNIILTPLPLQLL